MGPVGLVTDRLPANAEDRPSSTFILRLFMAMADERRASFGAWADSPTLVMPRPVVMRRSRSRPDGISSTRQDSRLRRFVIVIFCFTFAQCGSATLRGYKNDYVVGHYPLATLPVPCREWHKITQTQSRRDIRRRAKKQSAGAFELHVARGLESSATPTAALVAATQARSFGGASQLSSVHTPPPKACLIWRGSGWPLFHGLTTSPTAWGHR